MKKYEINNEILNIKELKNLEETIFFRKVTPKFFSHDEDEYHIESKIEKVLNYIDEKEVFLEKTILFHKEHQIEYIGQEIEVELDEFIELETETDQFRSSKIKAQNFINKLKKDFNL